MDGRRTKGRGEGKEGEGVEEQRNEASSADKWQINKTLRNGEGSSSGWTAGNCLVDLPDTGEEVGLVQADTSTKLGLDVR